MSKIWDLLHKEDTVIFFDIDGTLTSYNYGEHHAHHELDFTPEFRDVNIYADCKRLEPVYKFIKGHDMDRIFCISREPHGHESWKSEMVERLYGIPADHCYYTLVASEKPGIVKDVVQKYFPDIDPKSVICMDDNDDTLGMYMKETPFSTAHPMIFMEKHDSGDLDKEPKPGSSMTRREAAMANFLKGYNCSQSIVLAFADMVDMDEKTLSRMASSFGGGMGRLREVCGSVSGMFMIAGLLYGYDGPETGELKAQHYARIQELARRFEEQHGSIVCREMLGLSVKHDVPVPEARTKEYYKKRPCPEIIGDAAEILDQYIKELQVVKK